MSLAFAGIFDIAMHVIAISFAQTHMQPSHRSGDGEGRTHCDVAIIESGRSLDLHLERLDQKCVVHPMSVTARLQKEAAIIGDRSYAGRGRRHECCAFAAEGREAGSAWAGGEQADAGSGQQSYDEQIAEQQEFYSAW